MNIFPRRNKASKEPTKPIRSQEEIFLDQIQEFIANRVIWMLRDLDRNEGIDENKVAHIRATVKNCVGLAIGQAIQKGKPNNVPQEKLRGHISKMAKTLKAQHRFSPKDNPIDRRFLTEAVHLVINRLGIK